MLLGTFIVQGTTATKVKVLTKDCILQSLGRTIFYTCPTCMEMNKLQKEYTLPSYIINLVLKIGDIRLHFCVTRDKIKSQDDNMTWEIKMRTILFFSHPNSFLGGLIPRFGGVLNGLFVPSIFFHQSKVLGPFHTRSQNQG